MRKYGPSSKKVIPHKFSLAHEILRMAVQKQLTANVQGVCVFVQFLTITQGFERVQDRPLFLFKSKTS